MRTVPILLLVLGLAVPAHGQTSEVFSYRVKYVCSNLHPFPTVFHWTDINVLNPSKSANATVTKKFIEAGTQKKPEKRKPVRDEFNLGANQAASINCDEIQTMFGVPLSTPMEGFVEIESKVRLTVSAVYDKCVPQQRTDVFPDSYAWGIVSLDGPPRRTGRMEARGPVVIKKGELHVDRPTNRFVQYAEIESMDLEGRVAFPGMDVPVRLIESPSLQSEGKIVGDVFPDNLALRFPVRSSFYVSFEISGEAVLKMFGQNLRSIEPTFGEATLTSHPPGLPVRRSGGGGLQSPAEPEDCPASANCYYFAQPTGLYAGNRRVGTLERHCHCPHPPFSLPDPEPVQPKKHAKVPCDNAGIDVEYVEPVVVRQAKK